MVQNFKTNLIKKVISQILLTGILLIAAFGVNAQTKLSKLSYSERTDVFEQVWSLINEKYYDPKFHGIDWAKIRDRYRVRIASADSDEDFYALLDQMAGELRDSHTRVISPLKRRDRQNSVATAGLTISEIEGNLVVLSVTPESEAERAGVKPGMKVLSVNGLPGKRAFNEAKRKVGTSSSERSTRMRAFSQMISGKADSDLKMILSGNKNDRFEVSLKRRVLPNVPPTLTAKLLSSGIAYLKFANFDSTATEQIKTALEKMKTAPALILDLRNNRGGDGEEALRISGFFLEKEISVAKLITRDGKPPLPEIPMELTAGTNNSQIFKNPLVILTNEGTASSAELISAALQEHKRARIYGSATCGCVLGVINYHELKGGAALSISQFGFTTSQGRKLEGTGVLPDRKINLTISDLQNNRDAILAEAEDHLKLLTKSTVRTFVN